MSGNYPMSNFPNGVARGISVRGMPILNMYSGNVLWVDSNGSSNGDGTFQRPYASVVKAIAKASAGDLIMVKPGHTETYSAAGDLTLSVAGVTIVGLGYGSRRPTFTLDTATTATIAVSAANVAFKNCIFTANFADIVSVFTLTTAKNFTLEECYFKATATNMNFLNIVDTDATTGNADGLALINNKWIEPDTATLGMVKMDGTNADVEILGNYCNLGVQNNTASLMAIATGKIVTSLNMSKNRVYRLNTDTATGGILLTTDGSTNTGIVSENFVQHADTAAEILVTASSGLAFYDNKASGVAGASGYLLPAADS